MVSLDVNVPEDVVPLTNSTDYRGELRHKKSLGRINRLGTLIAQSTG
jgi:hypothetical protein